MVNNNILVIIMCNCNNEIWIINELTGSIAYYPFTGRRDINICREVLPYNCRIDRCTPCRCCIKEDIDIALAFIRILSEKIKRLNSILIEMGTQ